MLRVTIFSFRRFWAGRRTCDSPKAARGGFRQLLLAIFSPALVRLFLAPRETAIVALTGIALVAAMAAMLATTEDRDAAIVTFLATGSGVALFGLGSAFWGWSRDRPHHREAPFSHRAAARSDGYSGLRRQPRRKRSRDGGLTGLPKTIRRHELRLIVPLIVSTKEKLVAVIGMPTIPDRPQLPQSRQGGSRSRQATRHRSRGHPAARVDTSKY
jgi:hypothetical protein